MASEGEKIRPRLMLNGPPSLVLVCRKCSKKLGGGFGPDGRQRLAKALRRSTGGRSKLSGKARHAGEPAVIETGCLGLCPKGQVVVAAAAGVGSRPRLCLVPEGCDFDEVVRLLGLSQRPDSAASEPTGA